MPRLFPHSTIPSRRTFWLKGIAEKRGEFPASSLGGNGVDWIKRGKEYFPGPVFRLDPIT